MQIVYYQLLVNQSDFIVKKRQQQSYQNDLLRLRHELQRVERFLSLTQALKQKLQNEFIVIMRRAYIKYNEAVYNRFNNLEVLISNQSLEVERALERLIEIEEAATKKYLQAQER